MYAAAAVEDIADSHTVDEVKIFHNSSNVRYEFSGLINIKRIIFVYTSNFRRIQWANFLDKLKVCFKSH